jgi:hypothetical protein
LLKRSEMHIYPRCFVAGNFFSKIVNLKKYLQNENFEFYVKNYLANDLIAENSTYLPALLSFAESVYSDLIDEYKFKIGITSFLKEFKDGILDWAFAVIFTSELNMALYEHLENGRLFISDTRLLTENIFLEQKVLDKIKQKFIDALMGVKKDIEKK